jgi:hypothetical protein
MHLTTSDKKWSSIVSSELARAGIPLPIGLVLSIIHIESSGKPGIKNPKSGASGLMQVMPVVVEDYNKVHSEKYTMADMRNPGNPTAQIRVGVWILGQFWKGAYRYLVGRLGSVDTAELMKIADLFYVAGPGATKRKLDKLPAPSYEAARAKFPNWNALPHPDKLTQLVSAEGVQFNLDSISDWLQKSTGGGGTTTINNRTGAAVGLLILAAAYWWMSSHGGFQKENE